MTRGNRPVQVGIINTPIAPFGAVSLAFRTARLIGADHFWMGDHNKGLISDIMWNPQLTSAARVSPSPDAYFEPTVALARLAGRSKMHVGVSVTDPVRRSAADLARTWMTLHHATRGHAILGLGSGENQNTAPYGTPLVRSVSRLAETLKAVRLAWSSQGALVDFDGEWTKWHQARFALPPYKNTAPPIWVAAQGPRMLRIAGQLADGWIGPDEGLGPEVWEQRAGHVAAAARAAGKDLESYQFATFVVTLLAPGRRQLEEVMGNPLMRLLCLMFPDSVWQRAGLEHPLGKGTLGLADADFDAHTAEDLKALAAKATKDLFYTAYYAGTGAQIAERLEPIVEAGAGHVLLLDMTSVAGLGAAAAAQMETIRLVRRLHRQQVRNVVPAPLAAAEVR